MSMHEIENLFEESVRALCGRTGDPVQLRNHIYALYQLQNYFDCGFTQLRLLEELVEIGYFQPVLMQDHPAYEAGKQTFAAMQEAQFAYAPEPSGGFWIGADYGLTPGLYCEYGSPLWESLAGQKKISGDLATPPAEQNVYDVILQVLRVAHENYDIRLLGRWFSYLPTLSCMGFTEASPETMDEMQSLLCYEGVFEYAEKSGEIPDADEWEDGEGFMKLWFAPYYEWRETCANQPEYYEQRADAFYMQKDFEKARYFCQKGLKIVPDNQALLLINLYSHITLQITEMIPIDEPKVREYISYLQELAAQMGGEAYAFYYFLSLAHMLLGEFDEAEAFADKVKDEMENNFPIHLGYCRLLENWQAHYGKQESAYVRFDHFAFKLAVINALMYEKKCLGPAYCLDEQLDIENAGNIDAPVPQAARYFERLEIPKELVEGLTEIHMRSGNAIYRNIYPGWDGGDDTFDLNDISAAELAPFTRLRKMTLLSGEAQTLIPKLQSAGITAELS